MSDFMEVFIGKQLKLTSGFPFASSQFSNEGTPLIRIRDILASSTETYFQGFVPPGYLIKKGDILIGMDGDFHVVKWFGVDALLNQRVLKVEVPNESILALDYLFHWLGPFIKKVNDVTSATTVKHLSTKDLIKAVAYIPKVPVQRKIASILTTIDSAIEKTETLISKYQQIKTGLMHDLFTRGVLPNGQLRPPRSEAPQLYQKTTIGWIPKDWETQNFNSGILIIDPNPSHRYPNEVPDGIPICSTENFDGEDDFNLKKSKLVQRSAYDAQNNRCQFKDTDVIFARKGKIGMARRYGATKKVFSHTVVVIKPKTNEIDPDWILWAVRSNWFLGGIEKTMNSNSGVPTLGVDFISKVIIPVPKKIEQSITAQRLDSISNMIADLRQDLKKLKKQKLGLMQDLLTGKVPVKVDEPELEAST